MPELISGSFDFIITYYKLLFLGINGVIDNYGWTIIFLSLFISIILLPLFKLSGKTVKKVHGYEGVLAPQIDRIKAESDGEERHKRLEHLYKRYNYSPFMSILKVTPLFIQLPALFLTFFMLSGLSELNEASFFVLKNLAKPDALFFGINILPILMTLLNILAALTTLEFKRNDLIQASVTAGIFLVILYNQSSALLLYWTCNNALLLARNIFVALRTGEQGSKQLAQAYSTISQVFSNTYAQCLGLFLYVVVLIENTHSQGSNLSTIEELGLIFILISPLLFQISRFKYISKNLNILRFLLITQLTLLWISSVYKLPNFIFLYLLSACLAVILTIAISKTNKTLLFEKAFSIEAPIKKLNLILLAYTSLFLLIILADNPLTIYSYAPEEFHNISTSEMVLNFSAKLIWAFLTSFILIWLSPMKLKIFALPFIILITSATFIYSKVINLDYGLMDDFAFQQVKNLRVDLLTSAFEIAVIASSLILIIKNIAKLNEQHLRITSILFIILSVSLTNNIYVISTKKLPISIDNLNSDKQVSASTERDLAAASDNKNDDEFYASDTFKLQLSTGKKENVLIILLDGFSGGALSTLTQKNNDIKKGLKDFTWYQNTLTTNAGTVGALPAIVAGHRYSVDALIQQNNDDIDKVQDEMFRVLPNSFAKQGYISNWIAPKMHLPKSNPSLSRYTFIPDFTKEELGKSKSDTHKVMLGLSVFRAAPLFMKKTVYNNGRWLETYKFVSIAAYSVKYLQFSFLDQLSHQPISVSTKPSFSFIHLKIPHGPWIIDENGNYTNRDGKYIHEAENALLKLSAIFNQMKKYGVYDNSQILVISDHGWWVENPLSPTSVKTKLQNQLENRLTPGFFNALMLVKQADSNFDSMKISSKLMSNADTASIVCETISSCPGINRSPIDEDTERHLTYNVVSLDILSNRGSFRKYLRDQWQVHDNIFDPKNWKNTYQP